MKSKNDTIEVKENKNMQMRKRFFSLLTLYGAKPYTVIINFLISYVLFIETSIE
jgi:hypothetical protein